MDHLSSHPPPPHMRSHHNIRYLTAGLPQSLYIFSSLDASFLCNTLHPTGSELSKMIFTAHPNMYFLTSLLLATISVHHSYGLDYRRDTTSFPSVEPPFSPAVLQQIINLNNLPSLITTSQLFAGIDPETLEAFLDDHVYTNTNKSQANPIATSFPNSTTGTINGTFVILPIDYDLARSIVPSKYGILKHSIKEVLPLFPEDKYPVKYSLMMLIFATMSTDVVFEPSSCSHHKSIMTSTAPESLYQTLA